MLTIKKKTNEDVEVVKEVAEKTIVLQAKRQLTFDEHIELSKRLRFEEEQSGVKIILLPHSVKLGE